MEICLPKHKEIVMVVTVRGGGNQLVKALISHAVRSVLGFIYFFACSYVGQCDRSGYGAVECW